MPASWRHLKFSRDIFSNWNEHRPPRRSGSLPKAIGARETAFVEGIPRIGDNSRSEIDELNLSSPRPWLLHIAKLIN